MLGTELMSSMLERELLIGGDGVFDPDAVHDDRLSAPGFDLDYKLTPRGVEDSGSSGSTSTSCRDGGR